MVGTLYGIPVYVTNSITATTDTAIYNGDPGRVVATPAPGVSGSLYYPTQSPTHFGTTITASTLTTTGSMKCAIMGHKSWCRLSLNLNPTVEQQRKTEYLGDLCVTTQVYGVRVFRPEHAVLIYSL